MNCVGILDSFPVDVEEVLRDLRLHWMGRSDYQFNSTAFTKIKNKGDNIMFCCAHHAEKNPSCGIRTEYPYVWNCFSCGSSGNIEQLVAYVLNLPSELHGLDYLLRNYIVTEPKKRTPIDIDKLIDGDSFDRRRVLPEEEAQKYVGKIHPYITGRGFSRRTLKRYEVGYDEELHAVTFPVRTSSGELRFISKRFVHRKGFLNEKNIDKKDIIYGLCYILQSSTKITEIDLTESITDTMACYEAKRPAGAVLGRILFKEQVRELIKAGIRTVNLFFDNDRYGVEATLKAYILISKMSPIRVNVVKYPGGHWGIDGTDGFLYKDANDLLLAGKMNEIDIVPYDEFFISLNKSGLMDINEILRNN